MSSPESHSPPGEDGVLKKHRQERKDLQAKIQALKKSAPKGDKKRKKELQDAITALEKELDEKQNLEAQAVSENSIADEPEPSSRDDSGEISIEPKVTRAQRRRMKKREEDKEREKRISEQDEINRRGPRTLEAEAIEEILAANRLEIFSIPADGNCLYCAVKHQLEATGREPSTIGTLRKRTAEFMRNNKEDFLPFMCGDDGDPVDGDLRFENYCRDVEKTKLWGGQLELRALSNVLGCPIKVIQASGPSTVQGENFQGPPLVLTYHRHLYRLGEHYNSTVPKEIKDDDAPSN